MVGQSLRGAIKVRMSEQLGGALVERKGFKALRWWRNFAGRRRQIDGTGVLMVRRMGTE